MIRSYSGKTPKIHPTAWVSEAAYVIGDVEIGEYSSVWPCAVIRADTHKITLGKNVNIQDGCVLHSADNAYYGDYVTLGHGVVSHAKLIEPHCLVGNGATINGSVEIGEYSIIASGAVVMERFQAPPRSFVAGLPAQVKQSTTDRHHQMINGVAESYAGKAQLFKAEELQRAEEESNKKQG